MADDPLAGAPADTAAERERQKQQAQAGDPGRYTVRRTCGCRPLSPEPRPTGLQTILDQEALLDMVLWHFTLEHAKHLLAPASRQLAASVRDEKVLWKALAEFEFDSECHPYVETVHELLKQAYPFYRRDELHPYAEWLLETLCDADVPVKDKWEVVFECIPNEGYMPMTPDKGCTPAEVTDAYRRWLANPNRRWDVFNMKTLSDKIEKKCLDHISPSCWRSWATPERWCNPVQISFIFWEEELGFKIDVNRIHSWSVLGQIDEKSYGKVRKIISRKIRQKQFKNWNQFCRALLKECHDYVPSLITEDEDELYRKYRDVRGDFERDEGDDFEDPEFDDSDSED